MKKVFLSIVAGLTVLLLVGCGSKQTKEVEKTQASALTQKRMIQLLRKARCQPFLFTAMGGPLIPLVG